MKKLLLTIVLLCIAMLAVSAYADYVIRPEPTWAPTYLNYGGWKYYVNRDGEGITLVSYSSWTQTSKTVIVPAAIDVENGSTMKRIPVVAFEDSLTIIVGTYSSDTANELVFAEGFTSLPTLSNTTGNYKASIESVILPESAVEIPERFLANFTGLKSIRIPGGVKTIGEYAFMNCTSLEEAVLADGVETIGEYAFKKCANLERVELSDSVKSIGASAFSECSKLADIRFKDGLETIGAYAFHSCSSLGEVEFPDSVKSIGNYAFAYCSNLTDYRFGKGMKSMPLNIFDYTMIKHFSVPDGVERIEAFPSDASITELFMPESVIEVDCSYFSNSAFLASKKTGTIYCYEYSYFDQWALANDIGALVYIDDMPYSQYGELTVSPVEIYIDETAQAEYRLFPDIGLTPTFSTSNSRVFTVDADGLITPTGGGTATLGVKIGDYTAHASVIVHAPMQDFALDDIYTEAKVDCAIVPVTTPRGAEANYTYSVDNTTLASISSDGIVTTRGVGTATITVTDTISGLARSCTLTACYPVTAIAFASDTVSTELKTPVQLVTTATSRSGTFENMLVKFSSSDTSIATVSAGGVVTPLRTGSVVITARSANVSATCTVNIGAPAGLVLPAGITEIDEEAFYGDTFAMVIVPSGCKRIGARAFAANYALTKAYLPASLTSIARDAFNMCYNVVIVAPANSYAASWARQYGFDVETE